MAGCEFDSNNDLTHFKILESQQLQLLQHLGVKEAANQSRKNALIIFNTITFPQNVASLIRDEKPRRDEVPAAWEIRNGQAYAEGFGTPEEVWENTRIHNPSQYNAQEAAAALLGFKLLIDGKAKAVAYPMYDKSGIRYIPVLRRIGNIIINQSNDVGKVSRDLTPVEGADVLRLFNQQHENTSRLALNDKEFPLLVLDETPVVRELQELALGRSLISDQNPFLATQSISKTPELLKQILPKISQRLVIQEEKANHTIEKIPAEKTDQIDRKSPDPISNTIKDAETIANKMVKDAVQTVISSGRFLYESKRQKKRVKKKVPKPAKEPVFKQALIKLIPRPVVAKEHLNKFRIKFRQQVRQVAGLIQPKTQEFFRKLNNPSLKKKKFEGELKSKLESLKVKLILKAREKVVVVLGKIEWKITEKKKPLLQVDKQKATLTSKNAAKREVAEEPRLVPFIKERIKPLEKIRSKARLLLRKIIEKFGLGERALGEKTNRQSEPRKKPLFTALKETVRLKLAEPMKKIVKENKLVRMIGNRVEKEKIKFGKLLLSIFCQVNLPEKALVKINKLVSPIKENWLRLIRSREIIHQPLKVRRKIRQFWFYLNIYLFSKPKKEQAKVGQEIEVKKRPQKLKRQKWSFWLWLVKAISKRRENKIPALNFPKIVSQKKILPKSGVIFVNRTIN